MLRFLSYLVYLYGLAQIVNALVPSFTKVQRPWMAALAKLCEPGIGVGRMVAAKVFPGKKFSIDMPAVTTVVLCLLLAFILGLF